MAKALLTSALMTVLCVGCSVPVSDDAATVPDSTPSQEVAGARTLGLAGSLPGQSQTLSTEEITDWRVTEGWEIFRNADDPPGGVQAATAYRVAAKQGDADAQNNLAINYANGSGVPEDDAEAVRWFRLAAEQGNATAQYNLGNVYANGWGVPEDQVEAKRWFRLAAEQGDAGAQHTLGLMYAIGHGLMEANGVLTDTEDDAEAVRWFRLAAEQGNATAQYNLGLMYMNGEGVPQDYETAHVWLNLAASRSTGELRDEYVEARDALAEQMTREQIAEAQRRAGEWDAAHPWEP